MFTNTNQFCIVWPHKNPSDYKKVGRGSATVNNFEFSAKIILKMCMLGLGTLCKITLCKNILWKNALWKIPLGNGSLKAVGHQKIYHIPWSISL